STRRSNASRASGTRPVKSGRASEARSSALSNEGRKPPADLVRRVLLDEVGTPDRELALVGPASAEFPLGSHQDRAGLRVDKELGPRALRQPLAVLPHDPDDVSRLAAHGDLARPGESGAP